MKIRQSQIDNIARHGFRNAAPTPEQFEPNTMLPAYIRRQPVTTFLRDRFFPGFTPFDTKHVVMDFYKNRQAAAPFVAEGSSPVNVLRDGYKTNIYEAPFINISRPFDVQLLQTRQPGEPVFGGMSPEERAIALLQRDYNELDDMIVRREEASLAELLQTGKVTVKGYIDDKATVVRSDVIDFDFDNFINPAVKWDAASPNIYGDIEEAVRLVRKAGYNPTSATIGAGAWKLARENEAFMKHFNIWNANFGGINPQLNIKNGNGYAYIGTLTELGIDLYTYEAWYFDEETQIMKPYISDNKVIVAADNIGEMLYGANTIIPEGSIDFVTVMGPRTSKVAVDRNADSKSLIIKSRPVPKPNDVGAWAVINAF